MPDRLRPFNAEPSTSAEPTFTTLNERIDLSMLRQAVRTGRKLRLRYRAKDGTETERTAWPVVLGYSNTSRVLIAWCELRQGFRQFSTDRMQVAEILNEPNGLARAQLRRRWQAWRAAETGAEATRP